MTLWSIVGVVLLAGKLMDYLYYSLSNSAPGPEDVLGYHSRLVVALLSIVGNGRPL